MAEFEPVLLRRVGKPDSQSLESYRADSGYRALAKALNEMTPAQVVQVVKDSGLRGRGGAGVPLRLERPPSPPHPPRPLSLFCCSSRSPPQCFPRDTLDR